MLGGYEGYVQNNCMCMLLFSDLRHATTANQGRSLFIRASMMCLSALQTEEAFYVCSVYGRRCPAITAIIVMTEFAVAEYVTA